MEGLNNLKSIWLLGLGLTIIAFMVAIPFLRKVKFGQFIRKEGPSRHQSKKGTPTMGGIVMIIAGLILWFVMLKSSGHFIINSEVILIIVAFIGYGLIGLIDDLLIIIKKSNIGIVPRIKFALQIMLAGIIYIIYLNTGLKSEIHLFKWRIPLGFGYGIFLLFYFAFIVNAVNITDGIDGLAGGLLLIAYGILTIIVYHQAKMPIFYYGLALMASLIAYLVFNFNPAKIFMGDTGSLAYGAGLGAMAVLLKKELLLALIGGVFLWEILTVIVQVWYFKRTKGKRIFLMSPYHHHLELKGYNEWQIDLILWTIGILVGIIGLIIGVLF